MIDDNRQGLLARESILRELGYEVVTANCGEQGLQRFEDSARDRPFSLVVTDYRMPGMDGCEVVRRLRRLAPDIPLIMLSGYTSLAGLTPETTGADVVLAKGPHEHNHLKDTVVQLVPEGAYQRGKPPASEYRSARARPRPGKRRRAG